MGRGISYKKGILMRSLLRLGGVVAAGLFLVTAAGLSEEKKGKGLAADQPGPEHKRLVRFAGEYTTESKFWIKPDDKPMESKGTAKISSVVDGR